MWSPESGHRRSGRPIPAEQLDASHTTSAHTLRCSLLDSSMQRIASSHQSCIYSYDDYIGAVRRLCV